VVIADSRRWCTPSELVLHTKAVKPIAAKDTKGGGASGAPLRQAVDFDFTNRGHIG
jgi:hypothetical protein